MSERGGKHLARAGTVQDVVKLRSTAGGQVVEVDTSRLPRPDRTLAANAVDAHLSGNSSIEIVFGQLRPGSSNLIAALVVSLPRTAVPNILGKGSQTPEGQEKEDFSKNVEDWLAVQKVDPPESSINSKDYPERVVLERASTFSMSFMDHEGVVQFWRVSPPLFRRMRQEGQLSSDFLLPVVEVALPTELLAGLLRKLNTLVPWGEH